MTRSESSGTRSEPVGGVERSGRRIRVLLAKTSLDGHDRGVKVVAALLRDAGMEAIYLGKMLTPEEVVAAAVQEDVDAIGLSYLSGEHLPQTRRVAVLMKKRGIGDKLLLIGGCIPQGDIPKLRKLGAAGVFPAGGLVTDIVEFLRERVR